MDAVEAMENIRREHINVRSEEDMEGFERIVRETGIHELQNIDIHGFECHFCEAKYSDEKYIIVYQKIHIFEISLIMKKNGAVFKETCIEKIFARVIPRRWYILFIFWMTIPIIFLSK